MKKLLLVSLCFLMLCVTQTFAQNRTITGTVTAKEDGLPVPGVSVTVTGTQIGTQTNGDGKYTISVPPTATTLSFSFIGYATTTSIIGSQSVVNATLSGDLTQLNEVVVTGLGVQREKRELGYATATVSGTEINKASAVNVANGLQGKVSGLNITTVNSGVFEDVKINLRGIRSLTGDNNPLLLLDGVPSELNLLSAINPSDIESTNILKGPQAAAVYGPDARNGVIVVTTKKGSADGKPSVTLSSSYQATDISFFPKFQEKFGSGGYGAYTPYENWSWGPMFDGSEVEIGHVGVDGTTVQTVPYTANNSRKEFFNTGYTFKNDVGFQAKDFYMSIQDANVTGIVPDDENRRTAIRVNSAKEYGRFKVSFNTAYAQSNFNVFDDDAMSTYNASQNVGLNGGLMNLIFNTPAHVPLTNYKDFETGFGGYNDYFNDYGINPYFALDNWRRKGKRETLTSVLELNFKATDWLNFTYRGSLNATFVNDRSTSKGENPTSYGVDRGFSIIPGALTERFSRSSQLLSEFFASANKTFGDFKISGDLGTQLRQRDYRGGNPNAPNLVVSELFNLGNRSGIIDGNVTYTRTRLVGYFARASLNYKGWANIEVTGRNDQNSELALPGANNDYSYFYPSVNGAVVLTEAIDALKNNDILSYLKVTAAWSKSGNSGSIGAYNLQSTFSQGSGFPLTVPGFSADNRTYGVIKPEFIESKEVGIEASFFKSRLNIEASFYTQDNTDQIIPINVSTATGYTSALVNAASFKNKGMDLDLRLTPLFGFRDGRVNLKVNASYNDSEVGSIYPGLDELFIGGFTNYAQNAVRVGAPAFVFKATDYLRDDQGRVIVDRYTGRPTGDPNTKVFGRTQPKWIVGIMPEVKWKGLTASVLFEHRGGHYAFHKIGDDMAWTGVGYNTAVNDRFPYVLPNSSYADPNNPGQYVANTDVVISNINDFYTGEYRDAASNFITSAASWRLREAAISYDIPVSVFGKQDIIKGLSIAVVGRNLWLWLPKTNIYSDPDFSFGTPAADGGITTSNVSGVGDSQINPPVRTFGGTLTVKF